MKTDAVRRRLTRSRNRHLLWLLVAALLVVVPTISTLAAPAPVSETNYYGFGDYENSYAWSMAWFKGSLYVGTGRDEQCVEYATFAYYNIRDYSTNPSPGVHCPPDPFDMDLRAEIWRYTPSSNSSGQWTMVYQSPVVPNPEASGKTIGEDIGYRGMAVYTDPSSGEQALYIGAVTAASFIPELADTSPPRILRTTDGVNFTALNGAPDRIYTVHDPVNGEKPIGYRSMTVYDNRLFVTSTSGYRGDGVVIEVGQPASANPTFTQVSPYGMQVFDMEAFNNQLYIGIGDENNGYGVLRTTATGATPYTFTPVVMNGAGRGTQITSVVSMHVFQDRLYVGASGWYNSVFPSSELIRIAPDDSWELVVGDPRDTTEGHLTPISGLPDGFGNVFNAHFWRMQDINGGLYLGTNDWSWQLQDNKILSNLIGWQFGFDLYGTCNGQYWFNVTHNAFGDGKYNFGARTMVNTPVGGFIGTANQALGTIVFKTNGTQGVPNCARFSVSDYWSAPFSSVTRSSDGTLNRSFRAPSTSNGTFNPADDASRPTLLQADVQSDGTVLSWNPSAGATRYRVFRAPYIANSQIGVPSPKKPPMPLTGDVPFDVAGPLTGPPAPGLNILGQFTSIGTSTDPYFVDRTAKQGLTYAYYVRAEAGLTQVSGDSNVVVAPSDSSIATFDSVASMIDSLVTKGQMSQATASSLTATLNSAKTQNDQGQIQDSLTTLGSLVQQVMPGAGAIGDQVYAEEIATQISSLQRSVALANIAASQSSTPGGNRGTPGSTSAPSANTNPWGSLTYPPFQSGFPIFRRPW